MGIIDSMAWSDNSQSVYVSSVQPIITSGYEEASQCNVRMGPWSLQLGQTRSSYLGLVVTVKDAVVLAPR